MSVTRRAISAHARIAPVHRIDAGQIASVNPVVVGQAVVAGLLAAGMSAQPPYRVPECRWVLVWVL
ncbi:hypothetical protein BDK92_0910 [Micromonospora pisi]|uniref:Uncharacterized protein n=1 Tax=Micromonospora pisi TaxID=589240 RepID=A0A495JD50_9ACTN|nr:hypothetical protein BDK92_0910 [Micromonospora pisi]